MILFSVAIFVPRKQIWRYYRVFGGQKSSASNFLLLGQKSLTFFGSYKLGEMLCVSWAFSLIECVAVWTLKLPVVSAPLRSLHNRSPLDFLQHIPTYSKPTCHKVFLLNYGKQKKITHHMGKAGLEPINLRRIEGPSKLMQPKSLQWCDPQMLDFLGVAVWWLLRCFYAAKRLSLYCTGLIHPSLSFIRCSL